MWEISVNCTCKWFVNFFVNFEWWIWSISIESKCGNQCQWLTNWAWKQRTLCYPLTLYINPRHPRTHPIPSTFSATVSTFADRTAQPTPGNFLPKIFSNLLKSIDKSIICLPRRSQWTVFSSQTTFHNEPPRIFRKLFCVSVLPNSFGWLRIGLSKDQEGMPTEQPPDQISRKLWIFKATQPIKRHVANQLM